ncbi:MAG: 4Fe-4S binding protein [Candidatus Lokiarchaeota archaeon]|nr:4Fe-4S binding protein [Candidatus Lokiarchaeota archaeon]
MTVEEITDPYERILQNMREYPNDIPIVDGIISESFKAYIKLLFTPEEAEVAQYLTVKPQSISRIARKTGKSKEKIKKILEDMTNSGIIQDIGGYSYFLAMAHLLNMGFKNSKTFKRLGKKGAELYHQFFVVEKFYKRYESSDAGTPITRIVPIDTSIDHKSVISNAEEIHGILDTCKGPIVVTDCPCRSRTDILGVRECSDKFPISESCFQVGLFGEYFLRRGEGREITRVEAHNLVEKLSKKGLVFTVANAKNPIHQVICCCCACCCALLRGMTRFEDRNENCTAKSNYIAKVNPHLCTGCALCAKRCPFKAITIKKEKAVVNPKKCYGCGVCTVACTPESVKLHRIERSHIYSDSIKLFEKIYQENRRND